MIKLAIKYTNKLKIGWQNISRRWSSRHKKSFAGWDEAGGLRQTEQVPGLRRLSGQRAWGEQPFNSQSFDIDYCLTP